MVDPLTAREFPAYRKTDKTPALFFDDLARLPYDSRLCVESILDALQGAGVGSDVAVGGEWRETLKFN